METTDIREKISTLLQLLDRESDFSIDEEEGKYIVKINNQKDGALIGFRGKNLYAFERIVSLMVNKGLESENRVSIIVDVNNYRANRDNTLKEDVKNIAEQVVASGKSYEMQAMNPRDRKLAHDIINTYENLKSESVGEGDNRRIIVSVK